MRARHDLLGSANRMRKTVTEFREQVTTVLEFWRDPQAERFVQRDLKDIDTVIDHLVAQLHETSEFIGRLDQQMRDDKE